jgi:hypothetical protein
MRHYTCERADIDSNICGQAARWVVVVPHDDEPLFACTPHVGEIINDRNEYWRVITTAPVFYVREINR